MAKMSEFSVFGDSTPPVSEAAKTETPTGASETPSEPSVNGEASNDTRETVSVRQGAPEAPRKGRGGSARAASRAKESELAPAPARPSMDAIEEKRWQHWLGASAGKLAKSRQRAAADESEWVDAVMSARAAGMDEDLIMAAAFRARVEIPEAD